MTSENISAADLCELLEKLPTDRTDYREALKLRLLRGVISAYCAKVVFSEDGRVESLPGGRISERVWTHIFDQGGDELIWPKRDMSTASEENGGSPSRCDYFGVYFRCADLVDFLPIAPVPESLHTPIPSLQPSTIPPHSPKRGRRKLPFWHRMVVEVARRIYVGDITPPITAGVLRDELLVWLAKGGEVPDRTTVDPFFSELAEVLNDEHFSKDTR
jgi:hypothetical protein